MRTVALFLLESCWKTQAKNTRFSARLIKIHLLTVSNARTQISAHKPHCPAAATPQSLYCPIHLLLTSSACFPSKFCNCLRFLQALGLILKGFCYILLMMDQLIPFKVYFSDLFHLQYSHPLLHSGTSLATKYWFGSCICKIATIHSILIETRALNLRTANICPIFPSPPRPTFHSTQEHRIYHLHPFSSQESTMIRASLPNAFVITTISWSYFTQIEWLTPKTSSQWYSILQWTLPH